MPSPSEPAPEKGGAESRARLQRRAPTDRLRAVVLLAVPRAAKGRRRNAEDRRVAAEAVRQAADERLPEIDRILAASGGTRLSAANALGAVSVEVTPPAVAALAA